MKKLDLLSDQALGELDRTRKDGLGFETYARVLTNAALGTQGPFTIGVFGEWGTGKTSLMRLVKQQLANHENVITVWFNAWRYENEEHPIVPLVGTIIRELERHKSFTQQMHDKGSSLIKALRAIAYGFSAKSKVKVPGFAEIEASFVARDMIDRAEKITPDPLLDRSLYYQSFEALSSVDYPTDFRVVVLIDDLDRCFPDQAIRLLESIKLVLSQPSFIFVLGVARRVIEGYLQHRYEKEYGIADFQGELYLDKIVQLPFHIPPHTGRMAEFSKILLSHLSPEIQSDLSEILPVVGEAFGGNPRAVIRFINNIIIDLAINSDLAQASLMEEIPLKYFAVSRSLQQRWPDIFSLLVSSDEISEDISKWNKESIREYAFSKEDSDLSVLATALISDRDLQALLFTEHGFSWLRDHSIRRATVNFLRTQRRETEGRTQEVISVYDLYLSYSSRDRGVVSEIAEILSDMGIKVFMDTLLRPGDNWVEMLNRGILDSRAFGICLSEHSSNSEFVNKEIESALSKLSVKEDFRILPIMLPGSTYDMLPKALQTIQALDLRDGISPSKIKRLAEALRK